MQTLADEVAQQRIVRTGEAQIDDLRVSVQGRNQRPGEGKCVAQRSIGVGASLPARLENQEPRLGRDADDALVIVGYGGDDAGDLGTVAIVSKLPLIGIDEILRGRDARAPGRDVRYRHRYR